jgi:hypothetical protein
MKNIDSKEDKYKQLRKELRIGDKTFEEEKRVFRIQDTPISKNTPNFWLRMDLVQDIINAFFKIEMRGTQNAIIRELDILETRVCANPLLKSANTNVLVPNRYAPRFVFEENKGEGTANNYKPEDEKYNLLFKDKVEDILKEYYLDTTKFDNLQEIINPNGESFPVYRDEQVLDSDGKVAQNLKAGYWGLLKDLFINEEYFRALVKKNKPVIMPDMST